MIVGTVEATILVLLLVVVFGPNLAERFRIPGIVGLIFGGMIFGPYAIGWLEADGLVTELGAIGILYLMFLAGVSFDVRAFQLNRRSALTYGLLGFVIPFGLSSIVTLAISDIGILGAALIGAMWASNTLVAYPEVQAAGLQGNRAVSAAVSAGVVADLMSLTVMAFATSTGVIEIDPPDLELGDVLVDLASQFDIEPTTPDPTLPLWIGLPLLAGFCLWLLPKISGWFFVNVGRTRTQRFVFSLAGMAAGATVALLGGMEGLVGAFLAGLGMNRRVPSKSALMDRLDFVGNSIFVPTFLVSIGLNIDPAVLIEPRTLVIGAVFAGFVIVGKSAAALITGRIFGYTFTEIALMSSLSFGQAASTLAIAQVGLSLGMFGQGVVNAAVLAIVATAFVTSIGTRYFAGRVPSPIEEHAPIGEHVLLDIRPNGSDVESLVDLAAALVSDDDGIVVPYGITNPGDLSDMKTTVDASAQVIATRGLDTDGIVRVDESFADGTLHLVEEHDPTLVVLSWDGPKFPADYLFGNDIDAIGTRSPVPVMAVRIGRPWSRIVLALGSIDTDARRDDARLAAQVAIRLRAANPLPLIVATRHEGDANELIDDATDVTFAAGPALETIGRLQRDDLVVTAAHVLADLSPRAELRLSKIVGDVDLIVLGGPNRLSFSKGVTRRPLTTSFAASQAAAVR